MTKRIISILLIVISSMFVANYITLKSSHTSVASMMAGGGLTGNPDDLKRCNDQIKVCDDAIKASDCSMFLSVITFGYYCSDERQKAVVECTVASRLCKIAA